MNATRTDTASRSAGPCPNAAAVSGAGMRIGLKTSPQAIRDLDVWGQPSFWIYQAPFHRCARCNYRQHVIPPFKRKDTAYTSRFEQFVLRSLIGSTAEDVARRLGISAETVERLVEYQLAEERQIDPQRVITDIGRDELRGCTRRDVLQVSGG